MASTAGIVTVPVAHGMLRLPTKQMIHILIDDESSI